MAQYWGFRTDTSQNSRQFIAEELKAGALRQGWGWEPEQDLEVVGRLVDAGRRDDLTEAQRATWSRCQRMWTGHWGPIKVGDVLLLPKVPEPRYFTLVRVTGPYRFDIGASGDHGHVLPIETLKERISNQNEAVKAGIQRSLRARRPIWSLDPHAGEIEALLDLDESVLTESHDELRRLANLRDEQVELLEKSLYDEFRGNEYEAPVAKLLSAVFPNGTVDVAAGPKEQGADFVVEVADPFGNSRTVVIQLKAWKGTVSDSHALSQIRDAIETRNADEAILLTTAEVESDEFTKGREALSSELHTPIHFVDGRTLASLFLENLVTLVGEVQ